VHLVSFIIKKPPSYFINLCITCYYVYLYHKIDVPFLYHIYRLTNPDGRYTNFIQKADFTAGRYKLHFDVDRYFELRKLESLYPFIEVAYLFIYFLTENIA